MTDPRTSRPMPATDPATWERLPDGTARPITAPPAAAPQRQITPPGRWASDGWNLSGTWLSAVESWSMGDEAPPWADKEKLPEVFAAWHRTMTEVRFVGKDGWNENQRYYFRGVDAVVSAVGTAARTAGLLIRPVVLDKQEDQDATTSGSKALRRVIVRVSFVAIALDGSRTLLAENIPGEATDTADKAVSKAMSVALRTALIQAFLIPTGDPDPDADAKEPEQSDDEKAAARARMAIAAAAELYYAEQENKPANILHTVAADWAARYPDRETIGKAPFDQLIQYGQVAFGSHFTAPAGKVAPSTTPVSRARKG